MSSGIVREAGTAENPYGQDITIDSEGPLATIFCQLCTETFKGPLHRARAELLDHYEDRHGIKNPRIHSFYRGENIAEAESRAWSLRRKRS